MAKRELLALTMSIVVLGLPVLAGCSGESGTEAERCPDRDQQVQGYRGARCCYAPAQLRGRGRHVGMTEQEKSKLYRDIETSCNNGVVAVGHAVEGN
jgi:hypothetical protein